MRKTFINNSNQQTELIWNVEKHCRIITSNSNTTGNRIDLKLWETFGRSFINNSNTTWDKGPDGDTNRNNLRTNSSGHLCDTDMHHRTDAFWNIFLLLVLFSVIFPVLFLVLFPLLFLFLFLVLFLVAWYASQDRRFLESFSPSRFLLFITVSCWIKRNPTIITTFHWLTH